MKTMNKLIIAGIFLSMMLVLALVIPGVVSAQYYNCTTNYQERCLGNNLYWYDSCGNQQGIAQYCPNGCYNNSCQNNNYNYNNYNSCTYHAYRLCVGNNIYWYDSCGTQQDLYYSCSGGQVCQYGQCVAHVQQPVQTYSNYVAHYKTACYNNSIYWYDSLGVRSGLDKNCADNNSCTLDTCSTDKCSNAIKCDGSTCANGSADYNTYCATASANTATPANTTVPATSQNHCGNGLCETTLGETNTNCPNDCKINTTVAGLSVSFFAKQDVSSTQWQKTVQVNSNSQVYFMISVTNNSTAQIDNVNVLANVPSEISSLGNLQLNGVLVSGDIVSGIDIGSVAPTNTKSITFEGKTQTLSGVPSTKQATATSNISGPASGSVQPDYVSINFNPSQAAAAVSSAPVTSGFGGFLKQWYLWILVGLVLIFLFVVVFKRLSSDA